MNHPTRRLAAHAHTRQVEAVVRADAYAGAVDAAVGRVWRELLAVLRTVRTAHEARERAHSILARLPGIVHAAFADHGQALARWGWRTGRAGLLRTVPRHWLMTPAFVEDESPGARLILGAILPPPSREDVDRIVFAPVHGIPWAQRVRHTTDGVDPRRLADTVAVGYAAGKNQREIAKDLLPTFDGLAGARTRACRLARTEGMRIANASAFDQYEAMGPNVVAGYRVLVTLDQNTRAWHRTRAGEVYYRNPGPDQKGFRQMPHPPLEPEDPAERPEGEPLTAWNCRCVLAPVLEPPPHVTRSPAAMRTMAAAPAAPDPAVFSDWWDRADERRRRIAVGTRTYTAAVDAVGRAPTWAELIDPATGLPLTPGQLRSETIVQRLERVRKATGTIDWLRWLADVVGRFGFVPGE